MAKGNQLIIFIKIYTMSIGFGSNAIRRGLHIDDDDEEPKQKYQYQAPDANRKRTNFESDLDSMLFGGGPKPVRRRATGEAKVEVQAGGNKAPEAPKPASTTVIPVVIPTNTSQNQPTVNQTKPVINATESKIIQSVNKSTDSGKNVNQISVSPAKVTIPATNSKIIVSNQNPTVTPNVNKSTDSGKNVNPNTTIIVNSNVKVITNNSSNPTNTNAKNQPSIIVSQQSQNTNSYTINTIPIESKPTLPGKKIDNYVKPEEKPVKPVEKPIQKPAVTPVEKKPQPVVKPVEKKPQPIVPPQPQKYEEPITLDALHPYSIKNQFNKPGYVRKLKKVAQDFKFAQENATLHNFIDVVRPFETDRNRQRKHNDFDFKDFEFPSGSISLGSAYKQKTSTWKKPNELAKTVNFGKYIDPNDLNPGVLSNPHFVSTLSSLAELEANTKRLIQDQKFNTNGFYLIRLFINSVWRYITVDSTLPYLEGENAGVLSNTDSEFELSSALIQKAYAKSFGGYDSFSRVQPRQYYLRDLVGAPVKKYSIEASDLGNVIKKALSSGQVVLAVPNKNIATLGLNPNFSYSVINYTSKGGLELRNSFGTIEQRSKTSFKPEGTFELGSAQAKQNISHIIVSQITPTYFTSTIQSRHKYGFYSTYNFTVKNNTNGFLTVSQWDERLFPLNSGYQYSPFHIVLHKLESDGHSTFINAAFTSGARNLDLEVNLDAGSYTVFIAANWKQAQHSYNLTFYGSERVNFERFHTEKLPNLISQSLEHINVQHGRRSDISKNAAQYLYYQPQSNLVILTVENTSEKGSNVTVDLSKVKFDHLILLTSHNNEDNYSSKIGVEIDQYKQIPLHDRRWVVFLQGQHRFTWVLAADLPYSQDNVRKWGFN